MSRHFSLTADGHAPTEAERAEIARAFPTNDEGRGYCAVCRLFRGREHALCGRCWNRRSPFWRITFLKFPLLDRARLVLELAAEGPR